MPNQLTRRWAHDDGTLKADCAGTAAPVRKMSRGSASHSGPGKPGRRESSNPEVAADRLRRLDSTGAYPAGLGWPASM
jgi:hypothetical protein